VLAWHRLRTARRLRRTGRARRRRPTYAVTSADYRTSEGWWRLGTLMWRCAVGTEGFRISVTISWLLSSPQSV